MRGYSGGDRARRMGAGQGFHAPHCLHKGWRAGRLAGVRGRTGYVCTGGVLGSKTLLVVKARSSDTCPSVTESGRLKSL